MFRPGCETVDRLFTLAWELLPQYSASSCITALRTVSAFSSVGQTCSQWVWGSTEAAPRHLFWLQFSQTESQSAAKE